MISSEPLLFIVKDAIMEANDRNLSSHFYRKKIRKFAIAVKFERCMSDGRRLVPMSCFWRNWEVAKVIKRFHASGALRLTSMMSTVFVTVSFHIKVNGIVQWLVSFIIYSTIYMYILPHFQIPDANFNIFLYNFNEFS